jgi:hypothetical protein
MAEDVSFFGFSNYNGARLNPSHHITDPAASMYADNFDLYSYPSPSHRLATPASGETSSRSETANNIQRQSGAWSDEYEEWQDAVEWQKTVPKLKLLVPGPN